MGGAIKGPVRADIFFGFGNKAETLAGGMNHAGTLYVLLPRPLAANCSRKPISAMSRRKTTDEERALFRKTIAAGALLVKPHAAAKRNAKPAQAKLDLHGMTEAAAHRALLAFCEAAGKHGTRRILVVTGRSGVLKQMVPRWLGESDFKRLVAKTEPSERRHGGEGALYVHLRKKS